MSLLTKASLIATPTAYGDGVLNSVKPTDGAGDFDFARASSATRVNEQGYIEKERENLLLQSNQFDTTWGATRSTLTSGAVGYDGSNDAWNFIDNATDSTHLIAQSLSVGAITSTFSVYAKAAAVDFLSIRFEGSAVDYAYFDLANGVLGTVDSDYIDAQIISVGSGWYRCIVTRVLAGSGNQVVLLATQADNDPTYAGAGTTALYIQDAQVEYGLVATDYIETTTSSVAVGITNDIPRINYENGIGSFLLEVQRTNSITQSEYFGDSSWIKDKVTISSNYGISPEGYQNADRVVANANSGGHIVYQNITTTGTHTISIFAKASGYDYMFLGYDGGSLNYGIVFNLSNGTISQNPATLNGSIEAIGSDGWYRCNLTFNYATTSYYFVAGPHNNSGSYTYTGNGTDGILIYGAQIEYNSSYLTSYIPTYGSAVTRAAETCNNAGNSDLFNDSEGVLYAEVAALANDGTFRLMSISDGTSSNRITLGFSNTSNNILVQIHDGGVAQVNFNKEIDNTTLFNKIALKYKLNDVAFWVNGVEINTDTSATMPSGLSELNLNYTDTLPLYAKTKMVATFKEALSDSELECLTSWSSFERMATAQGYTIQ